MLILDVNCNDIVKIITVSKRILELIHIIVPIILIISLSIDITKLVNNPDEKNGKKKIITKLIATIVVFLIPTIMNATMGIIGNNTTLSSCWNIKDNNKKAKYIEINDKNKQKALNEPSEYEKGVKKTPTTDNNGKGAKKTNLDFSKIEECETKGELIINKNGKKVYSCLRGFGIFQNIAITDNYFYTSGSVKTWCNIDNDSSCGMDAETTKKLGKTKVTRFNKSNGYIDYNYVGVAGHSQSFDVANDTTVYTNFFAYPYQSFHTEMKSWGRRIGVKYRGATFFPFKGNSKSSPGLEIIPEKAIKIGNNGELILYNTKEYYDQHPNQYYDYIIQETNKGGLSNPELAVDEEHDQIAMFGENKQVYIYQLSSFNNGVKKLLYHFTANTTSGQGIDLYGNYLYIWTGQGTYYLLKYDITKGRNIDSLNFSMPGRGEAEGISVYKGKVYVATGNGPVFLVENM